MSEPEEWPLDPDDFAAYYKFAPTALAIRECVRLRAVRTLDLPEPLLDVGCGDGLFARLAYPEKQVWGVDINPTEVFRAQRTAAYKTLICGSICDISLPKGFFGSAIANCSLEHVPDLHAALVNIRHALRPGSKFALIVPTPRWTEQLAGVQALRSVGLVGLARTYGSSLDRIFSHVHLYDQAGWTARLARAGFKTVEVTEIAKSAASWAFDVMLYPSLVAYFTRMMTGRWIAMPSLRPLSVDVVRRLTNAIAKSAPVHEGGAEYLIVAEAEADRA